MKKIITLIILSTNFIANAQCPAPSNLSLTFPTASSAQLTWVESGTATTWETIVIPNFNIGDQLPLSGIITPNNIFLFINLPTLSGCNVFFVRSVCSPTENSPWVAIGTVGCSTEVNNYLATLSNDSFSSITRGIQISPNPSKNSVQIKCNSKIDTITLFDSLGKTMLHQTQNNTEINVENLAAGIYLIEIVTENEKMYRKFIKE